MNIAVLVSGGVDSSTALYLLKKQGYNPTAFYIKVWLEEAFSHCPWEEDLKYVKAVTKKLDVSLEVVSLQKEYWDHIIKYTLKTLRQGKTPNPDIFCNTLIKFGVFYEKYGKDFKRIATGHYARLTHKSPARNATPARSAASAAGWHSVARLQRCCNFGQAGGELIGHKDGIRLLRARDKDKDQTYFLSQVHKTQLKKLVFPIGDMLKSEVRECAKEAGLPTYNRPDSQGLCFLGKIRFPEFLDRYLGKKNGNIIDIETHEVVGKHNGYWYFTIGQREGLGIGGSDKPYYVALKDAKRNIVYVAKGHDNKYLMTNEVKLHNLNVLAPELLSEDKDYLIKLRHPHEGIKGKVVQLSKIRDTLSIKFSKPAFGVTEGQFGVLYDGDYVVASGEIQANDSILPARIATQSVAGGQ